MYVNILSYKSGRYLYLAALVLLGFSFSYDLGNALSPANGGSVYGFTSGIFSAVLMVWMAWLGIRKRAYRSRLGKLQGWVSAHVYLGIAILVVATLHTGFQLGLNIHSVAYGLLVALILTGLVGVYGYLRFPRLLTARTGHFSKEQTIDALNQNATSILALAKKLNKLCEQTVHSAIVRSSFGGDLWQQLYAKDSSTTLLPEGLPAIAAFTPKNSTRTKSPETLWRLHKNLEQGAIKQWLNDQILYAGTPTEVEALKNLITAFSKRAHILKQLRQHIRLDLLLNAWRWLHIPLTIMLLAALAAHILSVFLYW